MIYRPVHFLLAAFLCMAVPNAFCQNDTIPVRESFKGFYLQPHTTLTDTSSVNYTTESNVQLYDRLNKIFVHIPRTGNPGSAHHDFFLLPGNGKFLTNGFHQFYHYLLHPYLKTTGYKENRYSNIDFHLGSKKEQHIFITHQQRFRPWTIAGLNFGAMASPGDFSRQLHGIRNFDIYFAHEMPSRKYRVFTSFTSNRVQNDENGGIASDSVFENASTLDTKTLPVNLDNARIRMRTRDYFLKHQINLSALFRESDSIYRSKNFESGSLLLSHTGWLHRKSNLFTSVNPDSGYFKNVYFDTVLTYDSAFYNDLYNKFTLDYNLQGKNSLTFGAGFSSQDVEYETYGYDTSFNFLSATAHAELISTKWTSSAEVTKNISGDFTSAFSIRLSGSFNPSNSVSIRFYADHIKKPPTAKEIVYFSNHFVWLNDFGLPENTNIKTIINFKTINLSAEGRLGIFKNYIFYHSDMLPQSYPDATGLLSLAVSHDIELGKFGLWNRLQYQSAGNEEVIRVPDFAVFSSLYFRDRFFKNALQLRTGIDVKYHTSYFADGYMPATGVFFLQNEKKTGNYPYADFYVNLKISSALIFFKLEHFNAGLIDRNYYGALHYPLTGRAFKFGINWTLKD